jgi:UDP-glucuronate 4-epimerase
MPDCAGMRAVVTGGAGFVGSHLVDGLLARGDDVLAIDCFTPYYDRARKEANLAAARRMPRFALVKADLRDAALEPLFEGADVVFHQAAQPGVRQSWAQGFSDYVTHNIIGTQRLLEAVQHAAPTARVIYASSSSVYGNALRYPTREEDVPQPYSPYGVTKLAGEHLCAAYAANFGIATVSLRYFTVYGPRQRPDMAIQQLCAAARSGATFTQYGDGAQVREFTYVGDVVAANLLAAAAEVAGGTSINIAGGSEITLAELIALVERCAGRSITVDEQPSQRGDARRNAGAIDRAQEVLGWAPTVSLEDGIRAQLAAQDSGA